MPRIPVPSCVGPSNTLSASNVDAERTVNLYLESTAPGNAKAPTYLLGTPGIVGLFDVGDSPGRTIFYQDGRCFAVIGTTFIEIFSNVSYLTRGTVTAATQFLPATIVSNGSAGDQLLVVSGGDGYVYDMTANTLTEITNANFPGTGFPDGTALMAEFMDGYGIVVEAYSRKFYISGLEDFTAWDPLDVFERSEGSDNFAAIIRSHRDLWLLGTLTGEVWGNTGDALTPFQPQPGVFIETGARAAASVTRVGSTIAWLNVDERGEGMVMAANGYEPTRISTHALERKLQQADQPNLGAAHMFTTQQRGHTFLWLYVPDLETTWVYDFSTLLWHERSHWDVNTALDEPHLAIAHALAFGAHLVLARNSGVIYFLDPEVHADFIGDPADPTTQPIRRLRRFPLPFEMNLEVFISRFELLIQSGVGDVSTPDPVIMLRFSKDGGRTWSTELQMGMGQMGEYDKRAYVNRLGRGRNWVAEVTITDPIFTSVINCFVDAEMGMS